MKKTFPAILFLVIVFIIPRAVYAQQPAPAAYVVPATYTFDYEVVQEIKSSQKKSGAPQLITYRYSKDGDYMAITPEKDPGKFMIFAKGGYNIVIDADKKNLIVMRIVGMIGDFAKSYAEKNKGALKDSIKDKGQSVKTGNTKQICGYPAEEYRFTSSKGESSTMWCAKVDFNASLFFMVGMGAFSPGMGGRPGMGNASAAASQYPSITDPHLLLAEIKSDSKPDDNLTTRSITKKSMTIDTKGYAVTDMSNMDLNQMMKSKQN
jgi:hypothetical protein